MKKLFTRVVRTALLAMCALMALPASAADLTPGTWYLDTSALVDNGKQWFNNDGAVLQLKNGNDIVSYTKLGDYLYSFTLSSNATSLTVNRNSSSGSLWNSWTVYHDTDASHNCIKLTTSSGGYEWETYSTPVTGNSIFYFVNDGNKSSLNVWAWYANNGDTNIFSGDWNGRPDILNFDTNKVASGQTFTITKGYIKSGSTYTDALKVETNANRLIFGNSGTLEDFNGKVYYTASSSFSTLSGTWTDTRLEQVKTPEITQSGNQVSISCETTDAVIYYTLDGTPPSESSTKYEGAFPITSNCTVKAIAVKEGMANSAVAEKAVTYTNCFTPGTYYIKLNAKFTDGGAKLRVNLGGNDIECTNISGTDYYEFTVPENVSKIKVIRYNGDLTSVWASGEVSPTNTNGENTIEITNDTYYNVTTLYTKWATYEGGTVPDELYLWYRKWEGEHPETNERVCVKLHKNGNTFSTSEMVHNLKNVIFSTNGTSFEAEDAVNYGYATADYTPATLDEAINLTKGGHMFDATMGNLSFVVNFSNAAQPTVTVTPEMPHHLNLVGNINGTEDWEKGVAMTSESGMYFKIKNVKLTGDFAFINPITGIKYGARGADMLLEFQEDDDVINASGYPRRRSPYKWQLGVSNEGRTFDITVSFATPRNPSLYITKHIEELTAPDKLYIIGTHIGDINKPSTAMPMTKDGNKYYYTVENYVANSEGKFIILSKPGNDDSDWSMTQYEAVSNEEEFPLSAYKFFNVRPEGNGKGNTWKFKDSSDGTFRIELDFTTRRVHITFSEGKANDKYFLIGDLNRWLNDGDYKQCKRNANGEMVNSSNQVVYKPDDAEEVGRISYGYDAAEYGIRDDYELKEVPDGERTGFMKDSEKWYKLTMPNNLGDKPGSLYGQFLIYKGKWDKKYKDGKIIYIPSWKDFTKYSNKYDLPYNTRKEENGNVTIDNSYIDNADAFIDEQTVYQCGNKSGNLKISHNYYNNAVIYFTPDDNGKIYVDFSVEEQGKPNVEDIKVIYANHKANKEDKPVINANASSINSNNYVIDTSHFNKEMTFVDGDCTYNGVTYPYHWEQTIRPGMENPSGQKITVTLKNATGVSDQNWATIKNGELMFLDGVHVFVMPQSTIEVQSIEFRIYGYSLDGSHIVVSDYAGNNVVKADPKDDKSWTLMNKGTLSSKNVNSGSLDEVWTTGDEGPHFGTMHGSSTLNYEIVPSQATKFIQYRIQYRELSQNKNSMRREHVADSEGIYTEYVPDYFATDTSNPDATWMINGLNKVYEPGLETGIEDIFGDEFTEDGEEVETIYYNLQGQRVDNPDKGLYIRVRGTKTDKVLF